MSRHTRPGTVALVAMLSVATVAAGLAASGTADAATVPPTSTSSVPSPKQSTTSTLTLGQTQAKAAAAITMRINSLNAALSKVNARPALGSDVATLDAYLQHDITPLQNLGATIAADTTVSQARAGFQHIFTYFRVYLLVLPAARQAAEADAITVTTLPKLTSVATKEQQDVDAQNQATIEPMIQDLNNDLSGAQSVSSGVAATVLGYTPSQWNADHSLLTLTMASLRTAHIDLKSARSEALQIRRYLRGSRPAAGGQAARSRLQRRVATDTGM